MSTEFSQVRGVGEWSRVLDKMSQLWPGHFAFEPELSLDAERLESQSPLRNLADLASLSPFYIPPQH